MLVVLQDDARPVTPLEWRTMDRYSMTKAEYESEAATLDHPPTWQPVRQHRQEQETRPLEIVPVRKRYTKA